MTSSKKQKLFPFLSRKTYIYIHQLHKKNELVVQIVHLYYDKDTKLQQNNLSVCSQFDPLTPAHCNCENTFSFITSLKVHAIFVQKKLARISSHLSHLLFPYFCLFSKLVNISVNRWRKVNYIVVGTVSIFNSKLKRLLDLMDENQ